MSDATMAPAASETDVMSDRQETAPVMDVEQADGGAESPKRKTSSAQKRFDELTRARYDAERDRDLWRKAYLEAAGGDDGANEENVQTPPVPRALRDAGERILSADADAFETLRSLPTLSEETAIAVADAEDPAKLAHWLGANPEEAVRLAGLSATKVGREIAKIEARLSGPAPRKVSSAPPPPKSVKATGTAVHKTPEQMSYTEYRDYRNSQERAKLA